jgi:hypothetical protein
LTELLKKNNLFVWTVD